MAKKTIGELIREARTGAGMTQAELANKIPGLSASDISRAERNEKELDKESLRAIAKITGVTQKSLLDAASGNAGTNPSSTTDKTLKLNQEEQQLIKLYRKNGQKSRKAALEILKSGENSDGKPENSFLQSLLSNKELMDTLSNLIKK